MGQRGFFDLSRRYEGLDAAGDPLVAIAAAVHFGYSHDKNGQVMAISGGSANAGYVYDGNLKRVRQVVAGKTIYFFYSASGALIHRDDATTNEKTDYIRTAGKTIARIKGNTVSYMHQDHLGSSVASTTVAGGIAWREDFTPYGEKRLDPNANKDDEGFTGHIDDAATGLTYMQARYYDPVIGRFLSNDPVGFQEGGVGYFNRYAYTFNDPVNKIDPTGLACESTGGEASDVPGNYCDPENPEDDGPPIVVDGRRCKSFLCNFGSSIGIVDKAPSSKETCPTGRRANVNIGGSSTLFVGVVGVSVGLEAGISAPGGSIANGNFAGTQLSGTAFITPQVGLGGFVAGGPNGSLGSSRNALPTGGSTSSNTVLTAGAGSGGGVEVSGNILTTDANFAGGGGRAAFGVFSSIGQKFNGTFATPQLGCN